MGRGQNTEKRITGLSRLARLGWTPVAYSADSDAYELVADLNATYCYRVRCPHCSKHYDNNRRAFMVKHLETKHGYDHMDAYRAVHPSADQIIAWMDEELAALDA